MFNKNIEQDSAQSFRAKRRAILSENSDFSVKEAYKTLRTNIRFSLPEGGCKKLCVTSGLPSEGKSITTLNTAISFAEAGMRVLLIDADLRRPTLARLLIESGDPGLSNVLAVVIITVQTLMDVRIKSEEDLTAISTIPVLGSIPEFTDESKSSYAAPKTEKTGRR